MSRQPAAKPVMARWRGHCPRCSKPIERGDQIVRAAGNVWYHAACEQVARMLNAPLEERPS